MRSIMPPIGRRTQEGKWTDRAGRLCPPPSRAQSTGNQVMMIYPSGRDRQLTDLRFSSLAVAVTVTVKTAMPVGTVTGLAVDHRTLKLRSTAARVHTRRHTRPLAPDQCSGASAPQCRSDSKAALESSSALLGKYCT